MQKNLIVYFAKPGWAHIQHPYENIRENVEKKQEALLDVFPSEIKIYIARSKESHIEKNTFQPQFIRHNGIWRKYTWSPITADLVIGFNIPKSVTRIFNTIKSITINKTHFENLFPDYAIKSIICNSYEDVEKKFNKISTKLKVLKPINGTKSKWIFIGNNIPPKNEFLSEDYPYLLQEFFDTSWWFYGYPWIHDFRVIMLWWNIIWKFLRQPELWKYTANSFRRGGLVNLINWPLPTEIQEIVDEIEDYCRQRFEHRYYSIDFGVWENWQVKVFEMN